MSVQTRGGIPRVNILSVATDGTNARPFRFKGTSMHLRIAARTNAVRIFFSQDDFDTDSNYIELAAGDILSEPIEEKCVWMKGVVGASDVELMVLYRKA